MSRGGRAGVRAAVGFAAAAVLGLGVAAAVLRPRASPRTLRIVVSGDTRGFIVPCGCASKQFGGLPRRASFLAGIPAGEAIYLDAGGTPARATDYDRLKAGFLWRGMGAMGLSAANLGASEAALGRGFLEGAPAGGVPFVSANVVARGDVRTWKGIVPDFRRVSAGGARIAVFGVCSRSYAPGKGLEIGDPQESLRQAVAALGERPDLVVLLAHAPEEELLALARQFPEFDAILGTGPSQPIPPRLVEGRTVLAAAGNKGKFLAVSEWARGGGAGGRWAFAGGRVAELPETIPDDAAQSAIVGEYQEAARRAALPPERTGEAAGLLSLLPAGYRYAGSGACLRCHEADAAAWKASNHFHGLETIAGKGFDGDAYCLRCHTTGYGGPGGYRTAAETPALGGIGCESCHGPSAAHADDPRDRTPARARDACLTCHDPENSPAFRYEAYWPRIAHGKGRAP